MSKNTSIDPLVVVAMIAMLGVIAALSTIIYLQSIEIEKKPVFTNRTEIIRPQHLYPGIPASVTQATYLVHCKSNVTSYGVIQAVSDSTGSAWGIDLSEYGMPEHRYLITAAHVVLKDKTTTPKPVDVVSIQIKKGGFKKWVRCKILVVQPDIDTAVLEAEEDLPAIFKLAADGQEGATAVISGCPGGTSPSSQLGNLVSKDTGFSFGLRCTVWQAFATFYKGNSGGPIVDAESQKVVGMLFAGMRISADSDTMIPGVAFCIPCYVIRGLLDSSFRIKDGAEETPPKAEVIPIPAPVPAPVPVPVPIPLPVPPR